MSTLWHAVYSRDLKGTQEALDNDQESINVPHGVWQNTCVHYAARHGDVFILRLLMKIPELDINATNINGTTALHYAVENKHENTVKELLCSETIRCTKRDVSRLSLSYIISQIHSVYSIVVLLRLI